MDNMDDQINFLGTTNYATDPEYAKSISTIISGPTFTKNYIPPVIVPQVDTQVISNPKISAKELFNGNFAKSGELARRNREM